MEGARASSMASRSAEPSPSRCSWPTNSSRLRGRIRTASGCSHSGTVVCPRGGSGSSNRVPIDTKVSQRMRVLHRLCILARMPEPETLERSATELLQQLIRFDTVNPPGNEAAIQNFLQDKLELAGFDCTQLSAVPGRPNLIARLPGRSEGPRLCYLGHADTVLANPEDWTVDPWSGELKDGCVWGRGALDMKDQVASEIAAAIALAEEGWRPESGELMVVVTADEEAGGTIGAKWLCEEHPDVVRCDYVVNEGGGQVLRANDRSIYGVCVAEKGVFRFTLTAHGRAGHASIPRVGDNALVKLAPLIQALGAAGHGVLTLEPEVAATIAALGIDVDGDADSALAELERLDPRLAIMLEPLMAVTFSPTMVRA